MGSYIPNTRQQQEEMLKSIGYDSFEALFSCVPENVKLKGGQLLPAGRSEMEVAKKMAKLAGKNKIYRHIFRGAGAYSHYIPAAVDSIAGKEEFLTAYTPYQAEISQGILQSIFEFQTMICELTGMDAANASVYDGASAAAEGCMMCCERKRQTIYVSETMNPQVISVIKTYAFGRNARVVVVPQKDGATDLHAFKAMADDSSACLCLSQPNYYGIIEDIAPMIAAAHEAGAKVVLSCYPTALGILKTPGEYGADIAVGEGQPLGIPLGFGGPYLGFMAATDKMTRKLPGRIVGETVDAQGNRAFVLTLQAREQHIRREKAGSNICSNEAWCALRASIYMSAMGPGGLWEAAKQCCSKAHYLCDGLIKAGLRLKYEQPFFNEFVTVSNGLSAEILAALDAKGILGGLALSEHDILWCATEMNTKASMDQVIEIVGEVLGK